MLRDTTAQDRVIERPNFWKRHRTVLVAGSAVVVWLLMWKVLYRTNVVEQHALLLVFAAVLVLLGVQLVALGLLGELGVWQYFNPSARKPYSVSEIFDLRAVGGIDIASESRP